MSGRREIIIPLLFTAVLVSVRLAAPMDMKSNDQAKSAQYVLSIWENGEFLVPLEAGKHLPTKPPLAAWAGAVGFTLSGGPSEAALRVVTALEALLLVLLTVLIARRCLAESGPLLAGLIVAANYIFLKTATNFRPDALMAALVALAVWLWLTALRSDRTWPGVLAFGALGLATLAKGPVAIVVGLLAVLPWVLLTRPRPPLRRLGALMGIPLLLLVVAAWAVPAFREAGGELYDIMVTGEVGRHAGAGRQPIYTYLYAFPTRFLPWIVILPFGFAVAIRQRKVDPAWPLGLPLLWFSITFVAMSLFGSKRADYLLPVLPAAAILTAAAIPSRRLGLALAGVFLVGVTVAFHGFPEKVCEPTVARDFVRHIETETEFADRVHVFRMGSYRNAVLFHLGRTGPAANLDRVRDAVSKDGQAVVATTEGGAAKLRAAGFSASEVLMVGHEETPTFVLLLVSRR